MGLVVADDPLDREPGILVDQLGGDPAGDALGDVDGNESPERPGVAHRVEQDAALRGRPGAELDQRPRLRGRDDRGRPRVEDLALAAGRVVLGLLGDPLEQLRTALVVELLRRQLLERARQALADNLGDPGEGAALGQFDGDLDCRFGVHQPSSAQRIPAKM